MELLIYLGPGIAYGYGIDGNPKMAYLLEVKTDKIPRGTKLKYYSPHRTNGLIVLVVQSGVDAIVCKQFL